MEKDNEREGAMMNDNIILVHEGEEDPSLWDRKLLISDFSDFEIGVTTYEQIADKLGEPSGFIGSGIIWFYYRMVDGSRFMMFFGSGDEESILSDMKIVDVKGRTFWAKGMFFSTNVPQ